MQTDALLRKTLLSRVRMFFYSGAALAQPIWDLLHQMPGGRDRRAHRDGHRPGHDRVRRRSRMFVTSPDVQRRRHRRADARHEAQAGPMSTARPRSATAAPTSRPATGARRKPRARPSTRKASSAPATPCSRSTRPTSTAACASTAASPRTSSSPPAPSSASARCAQDHRGRRPLRAGRGDHRHQPERSRRADLPDARRCARWPACRARRDAAAGARERAGAGPVQHLLDTLGGASTGSANRIARAAPACRAALDRQGRSHRQGLDQPARRAQAPRRAGRGPARRPR